MCKHYYCDRIHCFPGNPCHVSGCDAQTHPACVCTDQLCTAKYCNNNHYIYCLMSGRRVGATCVPYCGAKIMFTCPNSQTARDCGAFDCPINPGHGFECDCTVVHPDSIIEHRMYSRYSTPHPPGADLLEFDVLHENTPYESLTLRAEFKELNEREQSSPASFPDPDAITGDGPPGAGCSTDPLPERAPP